MRQTFLEEQDGTVLADPWAEGFMEAVRLRADIWSQLLLDRNARMLLAPILALATDADGKALLSIDPVKDAAMLATAPPYAVNASAQVREAIDRMVFGIPMSAFQAVQQASMIAPARVDDFYSAARNLPALRQ